MLYYTIGVRLGIFRSLLYKYSLSLGESMQKCDEPIQCGKRLV